MNEAMGDGMKMDGMLEHKSGRMERVGLNEATEEWVGMKANKE
jgi:hypothetical protein